MLETTNIDFKLLLTVSTLRVGRNTRLSLFTILYKLRISTINIFIKRNIK